MNRLRELIKKHYEILSYLFFGGLTTLISFTVFSILHYPVRLPAAWSNVISWVGAVIFAFFTNKAFVFRSKDWSGAAVVGEFGKFVGGRLFTGLLETGLLALTVDWLKFDGFVMKLITSVIVVILNYLLSRWMVFRKGD